MQPLTTTPGAPRLLPFPLEVLELILDATSPQARAVCLSVNSAFYGAGVKQVYRTVNLFPKSPTTALPLTGPNATTLASYVHELSIEHNPHPASQVAWFPPYYLNGSDDHPQSMLSSSRTKEPQEWELPPPYNSLATSSPVHYLPRPLGSDTGPHNWRNGRPNDVSAPGASSLPFSLMTNLRTLRLSTELQPTANNVWSGIQQLCPRTVVLKATSGSGIPAGHTTLDGHPFYRLLKSDDPLRLWASRLHMHELVCVLDVDKPFHEGAMNMLCNQASVVQSYSDRITFVLWCKPFSETGNPPCNDSTQGQHGDIHEGECGWGKVMRILVLILAKIYLFSDVPLRLTVVNAGAVPFSKDAPYKDGLTSEERAVKFKEHLRAAFQIHCHRAWGYVMNRGRVRLGKVRDREHDLRFLSMREFLDEDNGVMFDEAEAAGWR